MFYYSVFLTDLKFKIKIVVIDVESNMALLSTCLSCLFSSTLDISRTKSFPLEDRVRRNRRRWAGLVRRLDENRLTKKV